MTTDHAHVAAADQPGPYLVALDIDGTVLSYGEELSPAVRSAVVAVLAAGHHVVLASGRSLHGMLPVASDLGLDRGWLVCSNGAVTARLDQAAPGGYVLADVITFDPAPVLRILREQLPGARFAVEDLGVGFRLSELFPQGELSGRQQVVDFEDLMAHQVSRVVVRAPQGTPEEFHALVERLGLEDVTYAIGWTAWMDIAPLGVTKASALEQVRRELGIAPARTVAVGDGHNDIDMLRWAARGVAMGHANADVRAAADEVTGSIDEDGVVPVLLSLLSG